MAAGSRRIEVEIIGSERSLTAALGRSSAELNTFGKRADRVGASMRRVGRTATVGLTLPIVAAGAAATHMALDYDTALNHVQALTGASAKQTKAWGDQILTLAPKIGQSPQQLAEALYFVASSGAKVNQVLPITVASAKAAASGMGDAQTVAQLLTSAMNAYGPAALSASKASDILTEAVKLGKAEPDELASSLGRVIPIAQSMGVSFAEAATSVSLLTNTGLSADEATTAVRATLTGLLKPASQTEKAFHRLGTSAADIRTEIRQKGLNAALGDLKNRIGDNDKIIGKVFPNVRALTGFLALTGKNAGNVANALDQMNHSTGAAAKAFKTASGGPGQELNRQMAQLDATAIQIGNDLLPVVLDIASHIESLAQSFSGLSDNEQHAIEIGLGIAALIGPVTTVGGGVATMVGWMSKLAPAAAASTSALNAAGVAMTDLRVAEEGTIALNPELAVFAGILVGLTAIGLAIWADDSSSSVDRLSAAFDHAKGAIDGVNGAINHLRDDQLDLKTKQDEQTAASLAVGAAQKTVTKLVNEGKKGTNDYKQAVNNLALAQDHYSASVIDTTDAANKLLRQQKHNHDVMQTVQQSYKRVTAAARGQLVQVNKNTHGLEQNRSALTVQNRVTKQNAATVSGYIGKMHALAGSLDAAAGKIQASNPILAGNERHLALVAREAAIVAAHINGIPTQKNIDIYLRTHEIIYGNTRVGAPPATTTGGAHPGATGAIVRRPTFSMIGEGRSHEAVVPLGRSAGNSPLAGGNRLRFVIDDLDGMTGYIEEVAGGVVAGAAARRGRDRRMGR